MCDLDNHKAKYCTGIARETCGHPVEMHDMNKGCTQLVESPTSEDHWVCGCKCVICIHLNLERIQEKRTIVLRQEAEAEEEKEISTTRAAAAAAAAAAVPIPEVTVERDGL